MSNNAPLLDQELQILNTTKLNNNQEPQTKLSVNPQQKLSVRNALSRISRLSVHNMNTALFFIRENWKSGMTQAMMNMPFILNAGNNTGGYPGSAYTAAFLAAFINGFFSGSNHSIYAPTWVAAGFNYNIVQQYGYEAVPWVTIIIGIQIYMLSLFKWQHLIDLMPIYVMEGYFLGLLFLIFHGYIDYAFGLSDMHSNRGFSVYPDKITMYIEFFRRGDFYYLAASFFVFLILYFGYKYMKDLPHMVLTSLLGVMIGIVFPTERCLKNVYGDVTLSFSFIEASGPQFTPDFQTLSYLFVYSIQITFYITMMNLVCAKGAEYFTGLKCDHDQEMLCVSLTNIACGIFNSIPCCAGIRFLILNIKVKSMNRWSSIINGLSVLLFYGFFGNYFLQMPLYVVSGQLLYTAYVCPTWAYLEKLWKNKRRRIMLKQFTIAAICYFYGAVESTIIGVMYSMLQFAERMSAAASEVVISSEEIQKYSLIRRECVKREEGGDIQQPEQIVGQADDDFPDINYFQGTFAIYRFTGPINYINVKNHISQIYKLPESDYIVLSFRYVSVFDDEALDKLSVMIQTLISSQRDVLLTGLNEGMIEEMRYNEYFNSFYKKQKNHFKLLGQ